MSHPLDTELARPPVVVLDVDGPVATVTLNRPEVLNALNDEMHVALNRAIDWCESSDSVRVVLIRGAGGRSFSVGQDFNEVASGTSPSSLGSVGRPGHPRFTERADITKPLVAIVTGWALGGGFEIALACDLIVCDESATFGLPEVKRGMIPGAGGIFRLPRQIGHRRAMEMLLTGDPMYADEAHRIGLVNRCVDENKLESTVTDLIEGLLTGGPLASRAIKELARSSDARPLHDSFALDVESERIRRSSNEPMEGARAFLERRPPYWAV